MLSYDEKVATDEIVEESMKTLGLLEDRVRSCVDAMKKLNAENSRLRSEHDALRGKMGDKNWEQEREALLTENQGLREKLGIIEERIRNILSRLESAAGRE